MTRKSIWENERFVRYFAYAIVIIPTLIWFFYDFYYLAPSTIYNRYKKQVEQEITKLDKELTELNSKSQESRKKIFLESRRNIQKLVIQQHQMPSPLYWQLTKLGKKQYIYSTILEREKHINWLNSINERLVKIYQEKVERK